MEPADYKRYVLPIIFLRFLSLRYDRRRAELEAFVADKNSDYYGDKAAIHDADEFRRVGAFVIPEAARWENIRKAAQADNIKVKLDDVLESLEEQYRIIRAARVGPRSSREQADQIELPR